MKDRIREIMTREGMTQQAFANALGIPPSSISGIFGGRTNPTQNTVLAVHRTFPKININWLMFGEGDMYENMSEEEAGKQMEAVANELLGQKNDENVAPATKRAENDAPVQIKFVERPPRRVTEIRVFFDDGTYEAFVPKPKD